MTHDLFQDKPIKHDIFGDNNSYCHYKPIPSKTPDGKKYLKRLFEPACNPGIYKVLQTEDKYCSKCGRRIFRVDKKE